MPRKCRNANGLAAALQADKMPQCQWPSSCTRKCRNANGLAAALQADKTKKSFGKRSITKTDPHHYQHWWEEQVVVQRLLKCGKTISREY